MQILDGRKTDSATGQRKCVQGLDKNADKKGSTMFFVNTIRVGECSKLNLSNREYRGDV